MIINKMIDDFLLTNNIESQEINRLISRKLLLNGISLETDFFNEIIICFNNYNYDNIWEDEELLNILDEKLRLKLGDEYEKIEDITLNIINGKDIEDINQLINNISMEKIKETVPEALAEAIITKIVADYRRER